MTLTHALAVAALRIEDACHALVFRLATWREQHAPETFDPPPADLWPKIEARIAQESMPAPTPSPDVRIVDAMLVTSTGAVLGQLPAWKPSRPMIVGHSVERC